MDISCHFIVFRLLFHHLHIVDYFASSLGLLITLALVSYLCISPSASCVTEPQPLEVTLTAKQVSHSGLGAPFSLLEPSLASLGSSPTELLPAPLLLL